MAVNILSLNSNKALDFLMKSEQFHNFELPEYFDFNEVLRFVRQRVGDKAYDNCLSDIDVASQVDVNFDILLNKDGRYAVRPLMLCNPYLYYFLARELCNETNWAKLKDCFDAFTVPHISSCALPVIPDKVEPFHKSATILNWWNQMEQRSIKLSLEYRYMFVTDITNCYGSVNPQTIDWALSRRGTEKATEENHEMAANIIRFLRDLQQGRNIGIPQGSTLFDLTGEIILGYSDLLLHEAIERDETITDDYEIIRYRDDYRIFCNNKDTLEKISYILQQVLESLNFRMNSAKTKISDSIVTDSIKPDKLGYIFNTPIFNKKGCDFDGLQKHLLYILLFGRKFPNSGQLRAMLSDFDQRVIERLKPHKRKWTSIELEGDGKVEEHEEEVPGKIIENICAMSAICTQIAIENVNHAHYALRIVSRMADSIKDDAEKRSIIDKVSKRLRYLHNNVYYQLWLQNMTYQRDKKLGINPYDARLCQTVMGDTAQLWNNSWLRPELTDGFPETSVINSDTLAKVTPIITFRETRAYEEVQ